MTDQPRGELTVLLVRYSEGDEDAFTELSNLLYPELKNLARSRSRGSDMSATTLLHETYLRYLNQGGISVTNRKEFFALSATIMRRIIIDEIRRATAAKRENLAVLDNVDTADATKPSAEFLVAVDQELDRLAGQDQRLAQVFECRFFAGYSTAETAEVLGLSERSTERFWSEAKAKLAATLNTH